jgi:hypothetical protein
MQLVYSNILLAGTTLETGASAILMAKVKKNTSKHRRRKLN